jgi:phospholipase C
MAVISVLVLAVVFSDRSLHRPAAAATSSPIQHIVIIDQENHSFDNVLGKFCSEIGTQITRPGAGDGCDGATTGLLSSGETIPLGVARDVVPDVSHTVAAQTRAIAGGQMNGFDRTGGCHKRNGYKCYTQFDPGHIPNVAALATDFALSDRTFELRATPSWAGHMVLGSATLDQFQGDNPKFVKGLGVRKGFGLGCDSNRETRWGPSDILVPACIPNQQGQGPFTTSPVSYVPTIFDTLDSAAVSWDIYGAGGHQDPSIDGYLWTICPTFYECLGSRQDQQLVPSSNVLTDARNGTLPQVSFVTPTDTNSQHNTQSMAVGDNWIGSVVNAIETGPDWSSTAIFLTWDDCGCFYDHVDPLQYDPEWGIRVPMIIVSPFAKQGYTDSTPATYASLLAYVERTFGLPALHPCGNEPGCTDDANAYDFSHAFSYSQAPLAPIAMAHTRVPRAERRYIAAHPSKNNVT